MHASTTRIQRDGEQRCQVRSTFHGISAAAWVLTSHQCPTDYGTAEAAKVGAMVGTILFPAPGPKDPFWPKTWNGHEWTCFILVVPVIEGSFDIAIFRPCYLITPYYAARSLGYLYANLFVLSPGGCGSALV